MVAILIDTGENQTSRPPLLGRCRPETACLLMGDASGAVLLGPVLRIDPQPVPATAGHQTLSQSLVPLTLILLSHYHLNTEKLFYAYCHNISRVPQSG